MVGKWHVQGQESNTSDTITSIREGTQEESFAARSQGSRHGREHFQTPTTQLTLAESEQELGIKTITPEALEQMKAHLQVSDEDFQVARVEEKKRRHDVMAHVHAFGAVAPAAAGIIHYGVGYQLFSSVREK